MAATVPLIDLAEALRPGGTRSTEVAACLREAAQGSGFFYVANHGVPAELVLRQFSMTRAFFDLPFAAKSALALDRSPARRGYEAVGAQQLDAGARPDLKESFYCGVEHAVDHRYVQKGYQSYGGNQWPPELPALAAQCDLYIAAMRELCERLMQLLALSLELPESYFDALCVEPMLTLRLLRYPPHPADADERSFGAGAHTDWGAITVLAQDDHGGLEVQLPGGEWCAAAPVPGTFVVNLGDMIPRWTHGRYHSNPHRVRNVLSGGQPRYSIPFFFSPDYEARIEPLPSCLAAGQVPRETPCTAGEHLREMYDKTYGFATAAVKPATEATAS